MTKQTIAFKQIDVFSKVPFRGNPVAVILDGNELSSKEMQQIANWIHLSETTFVCSPIVPQADYRLRIFSPQNELPFAGHPTIGSAYAVLQSGLKPKNSGYLVQECKQGLVKIYLEEDELFLDLPKPAKKVIPPDKIKQIARALGASPSDVQLAETIDVGAVWHTLQLPDAKRVSSIDPDMHLLSDTVEEGITGVTVFGKYLNSSQADFEVRSFAPNEGVAEDPVCGSGNGCVGVMVRDHRLQESAQYLVSQGACLDRDGYVSVKFVENQILLGGAASICIEGQLSI